MAADWSIWRTMTTLTALLCVLGLSLMTTGCDEQSKANAKTVPVKINGTTFFLEVAADSETRTKGLMFREHIEDDGGMIFVFPESQVRVQSFWMKNCLTDMDIIYLDGTGRVLVSYEMKKQEPKRANESEDDYEARMRESDYSSRFPATFAIEIAPGKAAALGVKEGDVIDFDVAALKKRAK
jgi:uncharacterized protein